MYPGYPYVSKPEGPVYALSERREKILVIPVIHLMGILSGKAKYWLPEEIPTDSFPLRTFQDDNTHSICIVVTHPSFPVNAYGSSLVKYPVAVTYPDPRPVEVEPEPPVRSIDETLDNREV